jgi:hypothetical protein
MRLNPIVATLGTNALLAVLWYSAGTPTTITSGEGGGGLWLGSGSHSPSPLRPWAVVVKLTPPVDAEASPTRPPPGSSPCERHQSRVFWAQLSLPRRDHARGNQPTAYEGNNYLLPTVAPSCSAPCSAVAATCRNRGRRALPLAARPVRAGARRHLRHPHARAGRGARSRPPYTRSTARAGATRRRTSPPRGRADIP